MQTISHTVSFMVALGISLVAVSGCASGQHAGTDDAAVVIAGEAVGGLSDTRPLRASEATLVVRGLSCPLCATNIDRQLLALRGVERADVDLGEGLVHLGLGADARPSPAELSKAVSDSGFTLVRIEGR